MTGALLVIPLLGMLAAFALGGKKAPPKAGGSSSKPATDGGRIAPGVTTMPPEKPSKKLPSGGSKSPSSSAKPPAKPGSSSAKPPASSSSKTDTEAERARAAALRAAAQERSALEQVRAAKTGKPAQPGPLAQLLAKKSPLVVRMGVATAQAALNYLGAKLKPDGLYGPRTATAWLTAAELVLADSREVWWAFERVDGKTAVVSKAAADAIAAKVRAKKAREASTPAAAKPPAKPPAAAPAPAPAPAPTPALPPGYDAEKARSTAVRVAAHLSSRTRDTYDRNVLKLWQMAAGIAADGIYGRGTRAALIYYGAKPPAVFFAQGTDAYKPPG